MVTLNDQSSFFMHTDGAEYGLIEGSMKSSFSSLPNSASMAFLTAGELFSV